MKNCLQGWWSGCRNGCQPGAESCCLYPSHIWHSRFVWLNITYQGCLTLSPVSTFHQNITFFHYGLASKE